MHITSDFDSVSSSYKGIMRKTLGLQSPRFLFLAEKLPGLATININFEEIVDSIGQYYFNHILSGIQDRYELLESNTFLRSDFKEKLRKVLLRAVISKKSSITIPRMQVLEFEATEAKDGYLIWLSFKDKSGELHKKNSKMFARQQNIDVVCEWAYIRVASNKNDLRYKGSSLDRLSSIINFLNGKFLISSTVLGSFASEVFLENKEIVLTTINHVDIILVPFTLSGDCDISNVKRRTEILQNGRLKFIYDIDFWRRFPNLHFDLLLGFRPSKSFDYSMLAKDRSSNPVYELANLFNMFINTRTEVTVN